MARCLSDGEVRLGVKKWGRGCQVLKCQQSSANETKRHTDWVSRTWYSIIDCLLRVLLHRHSCGPDKTKIIYNLCLCDILAFRFVHRMWERLKAIMISGAIVDCGRRWEGGSSCLLRLVASYSPSWSTRILCILQLSSRHATEKETSEDGNLRRGPCRRASLPSHVGPKGSTGGANAYLGLIPASVGGPLVASVDAR